MRWRWQCRISDAHPSLVDTSVSVSDCFRWWKTSFMISLNSLNNFETWWLIPIWSVKTIHHLSFHFVYCSSWTTLLKYDKMCVGYWDKDDKYVTCGILSSPWILCNQIWLGLSFIWVQIDLNSYSFKSCLYKYANSQTSRWG